MIQRGPLNAGFSVTYILHPSHMNFSVLAGVFVNLEIGGKGFFEHECNSLIYHSNSIHGVDQ